MNWYEILFNILLAFFGVIIALWYENLGTPSLSILPHITTDDTKPDGRRVRFLHLRIENNPKRFPFVPRQTAIAAHGTITFLDTNGNVLGNPMPIKWDGTPEPIKIEIQNNSPIYLLDPRLLRATRYIDIPPDEHETLAVAVKIYGDSFAYGWTGRSYVHDWRHPDYQLPFGLYTARIKIFTGDTKKERDFKFEIGDVFEDFDLVDNLSTT